MKRFDYLYVGIAISMLVFNSCGSSSENIGTTGGGGTPGLATGILLDNQGNPIYGASIWTTSGGGSALTLGGGQLAHTEFDFCPTPSGEVEHGGCTDQDGAYEIDCEGTNFFLINVMNNAGDPLPDIFGLCGGLTQTHPLNVGPQPTPSPTPTPTPTPPPV